MRPRYFRWVMMLAACLALPLTDAGRLWAEGGEIEIVGTGRTIGLHRDEMTEAIEASIRKAALYLRNTQAADGTWIGPESSIRQGRGQRNQAVAAAGNIQTDRLVGANGIIAMGLLYAGANHNSPTVLRALEFMANNHRPVNCTYTRGILACAFALADPQRKDRRLSRLVDDQVAWLLEAQRRNPQGMWHYRLESTSFDFSCSQFAIEALRMADQQGANVPDRHLEIARRTIHAAQLDDGSWPYSWRPQQQQRQPQMAARTGTHTMTAATVAGLAWLDARLADPRRDEFQADPSLVRGLEALDRMYDGFGPRPAPPAPGAVPRAAPVLGMRPHYTAYSYERAGILTGTRYFNGRDWYREMAKAIVDTQTPDGAFPASSLTTDTQFDTAFGTGFMLLFLGKGLAPTIVGRLDWGPSSKGTLHDMRNLTDHLTREVGAHLNWVTMPIEADAGEFKTVPLIYITGSDDPFDALMKHRGKFDDYLEAGGTLLGAGFGRGRAFDDGFKRFVQALRPGTEFDRLPLEHSLYRRWTPFTRPYGLVGATTPGVARPLALLVTEPFAVPLSRGSGRNFDDAARLGANIVMYLTQLDRRQNFLDDVLPAHNRR